MGSKWPVHSERVGKPTACGPVRYETIQPYVSEHWGGVKKDGFMVLTQLGGSMVE